MKKLTLLSVFLVIAGVLFAQQTISFSDYADEKKETKTEDDEQEVQTVMNSFELKRISGFGGPTMSFTSINGEFAVLNGGGGGILINNFFFGGYGEGVSTTMSFNNSNSVELKEFGHGGFWLGYEFAHEKMIHPVVSTRLGWGNVIGYDNNSYFKIPVFVASPAVSMEVNFTRFFKMNIGAEYRQTLGANTGGLKNSDLSGLGVFTSFIFGWF
ncbi:MAG: hypothetical protein PF541_11295 [Prolixibacteraceae bacterium]|jgi:hypothetical protein|nr:hypothetical protein [Prolixibacteraceae bacterium]